MPKRIDKITEEQTAMFPVWVKKWNAIGLSCEPADFEKAKEAALKAYDVCKLKRPSVVLTADSPMETLYKGTETWVKMKYPKLKGEDFKKEVKSQLKNSFNNFYHGSLWASWGAYVSFFRDVMHWENETLDLFKIDEDLITSCGWVWWHEDIVVICNRPREINLDPEGRLHNPEGFSISYRDNWGLYHVHGVLVPDYVITNPEKITIADIDKETNAEVRRVKIERYKRGEEIEGNAAFIRDAGGKKLDHDERFGTLWRREVPNDEAIVMIEVINSTREPDGHFKKYWLRVPPTITTAHEAAAWTFNKSTKEYKPIIET